MNLQTAIKVKQIVCFAVLLFACGVGMSFGGEKYVKTDLCEIDLKKCGLGEIIPYSLDVDEKDRIYYFESNNQELLVFNKDCGIERRMAINNKIKKKDETRRRLQVRNGNMALYPLWDGNVILFKNLESGLEESLDRYIYTQYKYTYFDGKLFDFSTSIEIAINPFEKSKGKKLGDCEYDMVEEPHIEGIDSSIESLRKKGGNQKTKPLYKSDYFLSRIFTIDKNKNVYARYKRIAKVVNIEPMEGERPIAPYVVYEYMLVKFDQDLNELCSWEGDYFYINEDTMNVYVLKNMETMPKFEKWTFVK